jgi:hypothetical protein
MEGLLQGVRTAQDGRLLLAKMGDRCQGEGPCVLGSGSSGSGDFDVGTIPGKRAHFTKHFLFPIAFYSSLPFSKPYYHISITFLATRVLLAKPWAGKLMPAWPMLKQEGKITCLHSMFGGGRDGPSECVNLTVTQTSAVGPLLLGQCL